MVLVKEFRIPMPFSVEEYRRATLYCQGKNLLSDAAVASGTEIIEIDQVKHADLGSCQFVKRRYTLDESFPSFMRAVIPSGTTLEEFHNNSFPVSSSILKLPSFQRFLLRIDTVLLDDCGTTSNAFNLAANVLSKRQVQTIDITKASKQAAAREHLHGLDSLPANWQKTEKKMMCVYKLVTVEFEYWGLKSAVESYMQSCEEATSIIHNQRVFCWRNQWLDYSFGDVENYSKAVSERVALMVKLRASKASSSSLPEVVLTRQSSSVDNTPSHPDQIRGCLDSEKVSCEELESGLTEPSDDNSTQGAQMIHTDRSVDETNDASHTPSHDARIRARRLLPNDGRKALVEGENTSSDFSACPSSVSSSSSCFAQDHGWTDDAAADSSTHGNQCDESHWSNPLSPIPSSPLAGSPTSLPLDAVACAGSAELDSASESADVATAPQGEAFVAPWVAFGPFVLPPPPPPPSSTWEERPLACSWEGSPSLETPTPSTATAPWSPCLATPLGVPTVGPVDYSPAYPGGPLASAGSLGGSPFSGPAATASPSPWIGYAGGAPDCTPLGCGQPSPLPDGPLFSDFEAAAATPPRPQAVFPCFTLPPPPPPPSSPPPCSPCAPPSFGALSRSYHSQAASPWGWEGRDSAASWLPVQ